jgi:Glycine rich protein
VNARVWASAAAVAAFSAVGVAPSEARTAAPQDRKQCGLPNLSTGTRTCSYTFDHRDTIETFVVPATVKGPIEITAVGAPGFGEDATKSRGAKVIATFNLAPGTPLFIVVGGDGYYDGYNGGVGGGGGASDVRMTMPDLQHRILVAGGGGGAGEQLIFDTKNGIWKFIVVKGGDAGQPGLAAGGGQPGGATAGGAGGGNDPNRGWAGTLGRGGEGADRGGGGGGGGLYGGGGGGGCAGDVDKDHLCTLSQPGSGGGGSSLVPPGGTVSTSNSIEPSVTLTFNQYG